MESRSTLIFFTTYTLVVFFLYLINQQAWTAKNHQLNRQADSLKNQIAGYRQQLSNFKKRDSLQQVALASQKFDGYDSQGFRVYGLIRDEEKRYTVESISSKFNIFPPSSVKSADVLGERWFIIPIKGLHFVETNQSSGQIARLYYRDLKDSVLIQHFNPQIKEGRFICIPFDRQK